MAATLQVRARERVRVFSERQTDKLSLILSRLITFRVYDHCQIPQLKGERVIIQEQMKQLAYANMLTVSQLNISPLR